MSAEPDSKPDAKVVTPPPTPSLPQLPQNEQQQPQPDPNGAAAGEAPSRRSLPRFREPHTVPLGSIFVWVIEGFILSSIPMVLAMVSSSFAPQTSALPTAPKPINIADTSVSITLMVGFFLSVVGHLVVANALNRSTLAVAQWAGGMHSAVSNSLCTAAFLCFMTYLTLYMDTCLFGSSSGSLPAENMCLALFRNTPFPQIVVAVVAVYIMMLFFVSLALAFVSCPQDVPSFTFVSKGSLLMTAVTVGYAYDMAAWYGTEGCPRHPSTVKDPTRDFVAFISVSLCVGIIAAAGELLGDIWGLRPSTIGYWIHILSDVAVIIIGVVCAFFITKLDGGGVGGMPSMHIGKWAAISMFGIVGLWSFVDLLVCILRRGRGFGAMTGSAPVIESAKIQQQEGVPVPEENSGEGKHPKASQFMETSVSISPPFHVTHMVDDDMGNYSLMKKRDAMPATNAAASALTTASHQQQPVTEFATNMFSSDEVRRSLRQRAAGVLHAGL